MVEEIGLSLEDLGDLDFDPRRAVVRSQDLEFVATEFVQPVLLLELEDDAT